MPTPAIYFPFILYTLTLLPHTKNPYTFYLRVYSFSFSISIYLLFNGSLFTPSVLILYILLFFYNNTNQQNSMTFSVAIDFYISCISFFLISTISLFVFVLLVTNPSILLYLYNLRMLLFLKILSSLQLQTNFNRARAPVVSWQPARATRHA